uniref:Uncharacterized protein n=1 Tax=Rhizophagus irregularis (strain DAOM 181602 / DAOM 197198 / MUCL 43194) TaxID=747089 RepID=U9UDI3_RHIID
MALFCAHIIIGILGKKIAKYQLVLLGEKEPLDYSKKSPSPHQNLITRKVAKDAENSLTILRRIGNEVLVSRFENTGNFLEENQLELELAWTSGMKLTPEMESV